MRLTYPVNFIGHDEWMESGYTRVLAGGEVISRDGEVLGTWRVTEYDPEFDDGGGRYEFLADGQDGVTFSEVFAFLDFRGSRGLALSNILPSIRQWHENQVV